MIKDINVLRQINRKREREIETEELIPLNAEGVELAKHKRFTFDIIETPTDPLRL